MGKASVLIVLSDSIIQGRLSLFQFKFQNLHKIFYALRLIADLIDHLPLDGKQLAGFATSGSSGFDRAQSYLERTVKENNAAVQVLPGAVLNNDAQMDAWLKQLNLN